MSTEFMKFFQVKMRFFETFGNSPSPSAPKLKSTILKKNLWSSKPSNMQEFREKSPRDAIFTRGRKWANPEKKQVVLGEFPAGTHTVVTTWGDALFTPCRGTHHGFSPSPWRGEPQTL